MGLQKKTWDINSHCGQRVWLNVGYPKMVVVASCVPRP